MLRAAIAFFVIGLVAVLLGANNVAGVSMELGRMLLIVFLVLAVISFLVSLAQGRGGRGALGLALAIGLGFPLAFGVDAIAEESTGEKISGTAGDASVSVKKTGRKIARKTRNATGNGSVKKDIKDGVNNTSDTIKNEAEKAKDKID
ncbi:MAG: DUF1328 domain-containing protein [Oligoflexia bacterium]|nr:DUF1328 domain-containing protein [Oligoflexia bacterium]